MFEIKVLGTPVRIKTVVLGNLVVLWALTAWVGVARHPERGIMTNLLVGLGAVVLLLVADFGHAVAHILSARAAGGPMEQVLISAGMPRTLYPEEPVHPRVHRLRATGGPIFSILGLMVSLLVYSLSQDGTILQELANWSAVGHAFIGIGSLMPLPMVDGGSILKWTLVLKGRSEAEADTIIRRVDWGLGLIGLVLGVVILVLGPWFLGIVFGGLGLAALGSAVGVIR